MLKECWQIMSQRLPIITNLNFICPDVFVTTQGRSNVQVKKMECDVCKVQLEEGECLLHSVKVSCRSYGETRERGSVLPSDTRLLVLLVLIMLRLKSFFSINI